MKIYLAGRISTDDWRGDILDDKYRPASISYDNINDKWPILEKAIFGAYDYVGPFFISCDHCCYHGDSSHGSGVAEDDFDANSHFLGAGQGCSERTTRGEVVAKCLAAVDSADVVFAWIQDQECFGTIFELGYAAARGKEMVIACPTDARLPDLWFALTNSMVIRRDNPTQALKEWLDHAHGPTLTQKQDAMCGSPAEKAMLDGFRHHGVERRDDFVQQAQIGPYKADFAFTTARLVVEVDGHQWHDKTPEQAQHDRSRDRFMLGEGWRVARFTAREAFADAFKCAKQVQELLGV